MALRNIILLTSDSATVVAVTSALNSNGKLTSDYICRDVSEVALRLKEVNSPAVLIDIDEQPRRILSAMEPLARRYAETKFVVLSGVMRQDLLLEAMQVGARHFLVKDNVPTDLNSVLHRICRDGESENVGEVITVLSAGGGCGATTVSVNLAAELQASNAGDQATPVLIVDLDHNYGAVGAYLGVDSEHGVFDLLNRPGNMDGQLIQSTAVASSNHTHVLVSLPRKRLGESTSIDSRRLGEMVGLCRRTYRWTIIDAPRIPFPAAAEIIRNSCATLLLMQMTVKDIRVARQMMIGLSEQGIAADALTVVANRYRRRGGLVALDEAEKTLGVASNSLVTLSNDFSSVTEAVNLGKPLSQAAPRSDFRRDLQKFAARLVEASAVVVGPVKAT